MIEGWRTVSVTRSRLARWVEGFAERHGTGHAEVVDDMIVLCAPDGAAAAIDLPFDFSPSGEAADLIAELLAHVQAPRRFGVVLVRKQAHAVAVFTGHQIERHHISSHYVQGRSKAGGWSQQRFARRRDNQARRAYAKAAADTAAIVLPACDSLDYLLTGGDGEAVRTVLADPSLAGLADVLRRSPQEVVPVPDPNRAVLDEFPAKALAMRIGLNELA